MRARARLLLSLFELVMLPDKRRSPYVLVLVILVWILFQCGIDLLLQYI